MADVASSDVTIGVTSSRRVLYETCPNGSSCGATPDYDTSSRRTQWSPSSEKSSGSGLPG